VKHIGVLGVVGARSSNYLGKEGGNVVCLQNKSLLTPPPPAPDISLLFISVRG